MSQLQQYIEDNRERFLAELFELLHIPSVSTKSSHKDDMDQAAAFIAAKLDEAGADRVEIVTTEGHPVVFAEKKLSSKLPTILVYGHYDVQPPEPLELWDSPPFAPEIRDGNIYARGASDNKGQLYMHIKAFEAMVQTDSLPCNVKFMVEGEEEMGSPSLENFCHENRQKLACDAILVSDTTMIAEDTPAITTGLRGLSYLEVEVVGPNRDLHSGLYGGAVANSINILARMLAGLSDEQGRITIPAFYDDVLSLDAEERGAMARAPFDLEAFKKSIGIKQESGEAGYSTIERLGIRPALDVNGIWGGYTGEGAKTVLPSRAAAKVSFRLVPNQSSEKISALVEEHLKALAPSAVEVKITRHHGGEPYVASLDSPAYRAASKALQTTYNKEPVPIRSGGSIPVIPIFEEVLKAKAILMGFGLDGDAIHAPNEHYSLASFYRGIETIPYFYRYFTEMVR